MKLQSILPERLNILLGKIKCWMHQRKVFLSGPCLEDQKKLDHIMHVLEGYKITKDRIIIEINWDILNSGDYLIRCSTDKITLYEIELTSDGGIEPNFLNFCNKIFIF
jgi:hypothetical protein